MCFEMHCGRATSTSESLSSSSSSSSSCDSSLLSYVRNHASECHNKLDRKFCNPSPSIHHLSHNHANECHNKPDHKFYNAWCHYSKLNLFRIEGTWIQNGLSQNGYVRSFLSECCSHSMSASPSACTYSSSFFRLISSMSWIRSAV